MNIHQNLKPWWVNCFNNIMKNHEKYTEIKSVFQQFSANFFFHYKFEIMLFRDIIWPKKGKKLTKIGPILKNFFYFCRGALKGTPAKIWLKKTIFCEKSRIFKFSIIYKFMVLTNILENMRPEKSKFGDL